MGDVSLSGGAISLFASVLGGVLVCIPFLFRRLEASYESRLRERDVAHAEIVTALTSTFAERIQDANQRYEDMKEDRDFHREEGERRAQVQSQTLDVVKQGVAVILEFVKDRGASEGK